MNFLDRIIGYVSPSRGLKRARARAAMRIYEGASPGRRANSWRAQATSANTEIKQALGPLRDRARDLVRNTPHAPRMLDIFTAHIIGTGIRPVSSTGRDKLDDRVERLFKDWQESADIEGVDSFYSLQRLALRSMIESGEVVLRMVDRKKEEATSAVPLHLQVLESDFIDSTRDGLLALFGQPAGQRSRLGVGLGDYDVRTGLWLFNQHPGEQTTYATAKDAYVSNFVANDQLIHLFGRNRPGQVRGISWFAPMITTARDFSDLMDAVTVKARIEACFAAFITQADDLDAVMEPSENVQPPSADNPNAMGVTLEPGMMKILRPGQDVKFAQPTSTSQIESVMMFDLMSMASAVGVTYDQLSGDLRGANYSSLRAGKIDFRALCEQVQELILIPRVCNRIWKRFIDRAILAGELADRKEGYPVEWVTPAWQSINPKFDEDAEMRSVRAGRMTPQQYMAGWGGNWRRNIRSIKEFYEYLDTNKVAVEIDVRNYTRAGSHQPPQPGAVPAGSPTAPGEGPPAAPNGAGNGAANGATNGSANGSAASVMLVDENGDPIDLADIQDLIDQAERRGHDLASLFPFHLKKREAARLARGEKRAHIGNGGRQHADRPAPVAPRRGGQGRSVAAGKSRKKLVIDIAGRPGSEVVREEWNEEDHPRDEKGQFTDKGGGDEGGGAETGTSTPAETAPATGPAPAPQHDPEVVGVGGDTWNKETAVKLEGEYAQARPAMEKIATEAEGSTVSLTEHDEDSTYIDSWDSMPGDKQTEAEEHFVEAATQDEVNYLEENYFNEGEARDDAAYEIAHDFSSDSDWAKDAMAEYEKAREEEGKGELPFTSKQILDAINIIEPDRSYGGKPKDPDIYFKDDKLTEPKGFDPAQETLPGIEKVPPHALLTEEMRDDITQYLTDAFNEAADEKAPDMSAPDFTEQAKESVGEFWDQKSDDEKFSYAKQHGIVEEGYQEGETVGGDAPVTVPDTFDPLNETSGTDYRETQALARHMSIERALEVIQERGIDLDGEHPVTRESVQHADNELWGGWKGSSTSVEGHILQLAIATELGGRYNQRGEYSTDEIIEKANNRYYNIGGWKGVLAYTRAKWETTQYLLEQADIKTLDLYRGVNINDKAKLDSLDREKVQGGVKEYTKLPDIDLLRNGAASTTVSPSVANGWGSSDSRVVIRLQVPRTAVISVPAYGINIHSEREVVVAGTAWKGWDAWHKTAPDFDTVPMAKAA